MIVIQELKNFFNAKTFILRYMDRFYHPGGQHLLPPRHQIFEEIYCDIVVRRKENANITSKKVEYLSLASIFGWKLLWWNSRGRIHHGICNRIWLICSAHVYEFLKLILIIQEKFNEIVRRFLLICKNYSEVSPLNSWINLSIYFFLF